MIDEKRFAQMIRSFPEERSKINREYDLKVDDVSIEFVNNHEGKTCLKYASPNLTFMCMSSSPIVSIERLDIGYRIVTVSGVEYLMLREKK